MRSVTPQASSRRDARARLISASAVVARRLTSPERPEDGVSGCGLRRSRLFWTRRNKPKQAFEIVGRANQRQLSLDFFNASQNKRAESHCAFHDTERRFNGDLAFGVKCMAVERL
jgi:hypothetical protein